MLDILSAISEHCNVEILREKNCKLRERKELKKNETKAVNQRRNKNIECQNTNKRKDKNKVHNKREYYRSSYMYVE